MCVIAVISEYSIPAVGLIYRVPCLLLSIGNLDVNFSYIMTKSATAFGVQLTKQEFVSNLGEKLAGLNLGIPGLLYKVI